MALRGTADSIVTEVGNDGTPIPAAALETIFKPLVHLPAAGDDTRAPVPAWGCSSRVK